MKSMKKYIIPLIALTALTGSYDRMGGQRPSLHTYVHQSSGFQTREE